MKTPFVPIIPKAFSYLGDASIQRFLTEVCDKKTIDSFCRKVKAAKKYNSSLSSLAFRNYLEMQIVTSLGRQEMTGLFDDMPGRMLDGFFEAAEFLTVAAAVYEQLCPRLKFKFARTFNGMFENPQGLIPLSHEFISAYQLTQMGFEVEFVELSERGSFDFEISKNGVVAQVDCKSVSSDNGRSF